ncbi:MAG: Alkyl hydroperoxide reductase/ Thiol specific antioxidant/ Mal allergen [uncultured Aureispira sp.]|uniref:thioredoxin-dependent peroxiredoxin n=1 Tax=uncultured Aureispira sp. TaxID=1331704 RepID=A0A6S6RTY2_9BACT|nr:MAG: Alkyl hydroperoxide reductase/ Thiol specific antioxidant/ Mal allergen [uncultured Aureispira sp.]
MEIVMGLVKEGLWTCFVIALFAILIKYPYCNLSQFIALAAYIFGYSVLILKIKTMSKLLALFFCVLFSTSPLFAQEEAIFVSEAKETKEHPRLNVGDKASSFRIKDVRGNNVSLVKILKKNKLLLVFLRHAWCPVCNYRTHELLENYTNLKKHGYEVVVVYESNAANLLPYVKDLNLPYPIISDPEGKLYQTYKVEYSLAKAQASRTNKKMLAHYQKGNKLFGGKKYKKEKKEERSTIIPADFIICKAKKIEIAHYGEYIGDHLSVKNLLEQTISTSHGGAEHKVKTNVRF